MGAKRSMAQKIILAIVFISLLFSIGFTIVRIVQTPATLGEDPVHDKTRSDYVLMLVQCCLGIVAIFLPNILNNRWRIEIPSPMVILYLIFLYAAIYLGEVRSFYYRVPHFDTMLHGLSGGMLGALAFSVIAFFNKTEKIPMHLSPIFVAVFAFCFAMTLGVIWEFYEYAVDSIMGLNMQKYLTEDGTALVGRLALIDTMKDLMVNAIGSGTVSIIGYISLKYKKGWVEKLLVRKHKQPESK